MKTIFKILCAAIVVALLSGGAWFLWNRTTNKATAVTASTTTTAPAPATTEAKATVIVVNATPVPTATPAPTATSAPEVDVRKVTEAGSQTQAWHLFVSSVDSAQEWLNSQDWVNLEEKFVAMNNGMNFYQSIEVSEAKANDTYVGWWTASQALEDDFALTGEVDVLRADGRFVAIQVATAQEDIRVNHAESVRGIDDDATNGRFVRQGDDRWVLNDEYASGEAYSTANVLGKLRSVDGFAQAGRLGDSMGLMKVHEGEYRFVLYIAEATATVVASNGGGNGGGDNDPENSGKPDDPEKVDGMPENSSQPSGDPERVVTESNGDGSSQGWDVDRYSSVNTGEGTAYNSADPTDTTTTTTETTTTTTETTTGAGQSGGSSGGWDFTRWENSSPDNSL